jgi:1,4-dihydroxy-2-naphthoate octaprenyltransferase
MDKKYLKELAEKLELAQEKKDKTYFDFFKSVSTLSVALIGLLIGLKASPIPNQSAKYFFLLTIVLIGLCILFSLATQFYESIFDNQKAEVRQKQLVKYIENPDGNNIQVDRLKKVKLYKFFEIMTFVCLVLSILSLILYVYFLEF